MISKVVVLPYCLGTLCQQFFREKVPACPNDCSLSPQKYLLFGVLSLVLSLSPPELHILMMVVLASQLYDFKFVLYK